MADKQHAEGSSTSDASSGISESTVQLNIKTLESQIYSFHVDKNIPISLFKEKIASEIGLPVAQQRLIFRGKVLKDDHLLSEYHVENGHTLHLVARQPTQPQTSISTNNMETSANNGGRGQEPGVGGLRNRVGQISHSVVLGTFNVGDQGEGAVPDVSRVIGAVLNSIGIGNPAGGVGGMQPNVLFNAPVQPPQGNGAQGPRGNVGAQNQAGNQSQPGQAFPSQSSSEMLQIPLGGGIPLPSLNAPIPDSLNTLTEFMNRMERALSQHGYRPDQSSNDAGDQPTVELPSNAHGLSTPDTLNIVLRHAQHLLGHHAVAALSHIAGRLEQDGGSNDPTVRGQIQTECVHVGMAMQQLGALFLELGRTIWTLRMGQSPAESSVNSGPAVYISSSGPNPIMVQPFPFQTSSLLGGTAAPNNGALGPSSIVNIPRHVNIHIHTGASLAPIVSAVSSRTANGEGTEEERVTGTSSSGASSGDSVQTGALPVRNVFATAVPSQPIVGLLSNPGQLGVNVSPPSSESVPPSNVVAEVSCQIRSFVDNMHSENQVHSGQSGSSTLQDQSVGPGTDSRARETCQAEDRKRSENEHADDVGLNDVPSSSSVGGSNDRPAGEAGQKLVVDAEDAPRPGQGNNNYHGATAVPLGLGLGGLQPKRRTKPSRSLGKSSDGGAFGAAPNIAQQTGTDAQQLLQSLASHASGSSANTLPSGQLSQAIDQSDVSSAMSQVLHSPAMNGLLTGVSQQSGLGSPDILRTMLQQLTQSPAMMNTVSQIAQQIETQDPGSMFAGLGTGQDGTIDLSRMVQQMMPVVSQALGARSSVPQPVSSVEHEPQLFYNERQPSSGGKPDDENSQIDLQQVSQRIENRCPDGEIFRSMVEAAANLYNNSSDADDLVDALCAEEGLASEFMDILRSDLSQRLQNASLDKP